MNVCDYLLEGKPGPSAALLIAGDQYSYAHLQSTTLNIAAFLVKSGSKKGDRAILVAENTFFWVVAYLGIIKAGLVCVPLPPKLSPEDLEYVFRMTEPAFAFVESRIIDKVFAQGRATKLITDVPVSVSEHPIATSLVELQEAAARPVSLPQVGSDDLAVLMFTSGSTGKPRGVMLSNRNIIANTDSIVQCLSLTARDRIMTVLPFHYCFGTSLLHTHLRVGGTLVIEPRFMYSEVVLHRMQETACTGFAGVPAHFQILLRKSQIAKMAFPHLRYVQQAGGQLAPAFIRELREALPGKQIFIMYGQTEATARLSFLPPEMLDTKLGSIGKGIPGVTLSVLDESDRPVRPGQIGQIVAEGENVGLGYWRDERESAQCFRGAKLYTGDLATLDEDGFIYIVDRAKDFLKCGGTRVSSRYLENILLEHPELLEAAVIGVFDEVLGEAAAAYVVARNRDAGPTPEQLDKYCRQRLPLALVPKQFVMLSTLPKNSSGKVLKALLKAEPLPVNAN